MTPISFHHEDGLFLRLQIIMFLKYIKKYLCLLCSYTLPVKVKVLLGYMPN